MVRSNKKVKRIGIGSIKLDSLYGGLYFADDLFRGIPKKLRVNSANGFEVTSVYDFDKKAFIDGTLGNILLRAQNENNLQTLLSLDNEDLLANEPLLDITVAIPEKTDSAEYQNLLKWTQDVSRQLDMNSDKDMILDDCECHVVPVMLSGKGNYHKYQGLQLALTNPLDVKISFAEPLDI